MVHGTYAKAGQPGRPFTFRSVVAVPIGFDVTPMPNDRYENATFKSITGISVELFQIRATTVYAVFAFNWCGSTSAAPSKT